MLFNSLSTRSTLSLSATLATLVLASSAWAGPPIPVVVDAETFFEDCGAPFFVDVDTTVTGKAEIDGSCEASVLADTSLTFDKVKLEFTGSFFVSGRAASVDILKSKITAASVTVDAETAMNIDRSTLTATAGAINIPPRNGATLTKSKFIAVDNITFAGTSGPFVTDKIQVSAGGTFNVAPGFGTLPNVLGGSKFAAAQISLGGSNPYDLDKSQFEAGSIGLWPGGGGPANTIDDCKFNATSGTVQWVGARDVIATNTKIRGIGDGSAAGFRCSPGGPFVGCSLTDSKVQTASFIEFGGSAASVTGSTLIAEGANLSGIGIRFGGGPGATLTDSKISAKSGNIQLQASGTCSIVNSKLSAFGFTDDLVLFYVGADPESAGPVGILVSCFLGMTVEGSSFKSIDGSFAFLGQGPNISDSRFVTKGTTGVILGNNSAATVVDSKFTAPFGKLQLLGTGFGLAGNKLKLAEDGFRMETTVESSIDTTTMKTTNLTIRSFGDTTVTGSKLKASGAVEVSADGTCTSAGNTPELPCL